LASLVEYGPNTYPLAISIGLSGAANRA
jgi:hypothetical protein